MKTKKGGGNKPQTYNPADGKYTDKDISNQKDSFYQQYYSLNSETVKYFKKNNIPFDFPSPYLHDYGYAKFYLKHIVKTVNISLEDDKLFNYIMVYKERDNKNYLINNLGYYKHNINLLKRDILDGTNFNIKIMSIFKDKTYTFLSPTTIYDNVLKNHFIVIQYGKWMTKIAFILCQLYYTRRKKMKKIKLFDHVRLIEALMHNLDFESETFKDCKVGLTGIVVDIIDDNNILIELDDDSDAPAPVISASINDLEIIE